MARGRRMTRSRSRVFLALFWISLICFFGMLFVGAPGGPILKAAFYLLNLLGLIFGVGSGVMPWAATRLIRRFDMANDPRYAEAYGLLRDAELAEG